MRPRGSGRVFKRGTRYWIAYYDGHGKEQREPAGTKLDVDGRRVPKSARDAQDLLHIRLAAVHQGTGSGRAGRRLTVKEVLDAYKTNLEARGKKSIDKIVSHLPCPTAGRESHAPEHGQNADSEAGYRCVSSRF
jgi:hypothetical protein